MDNKTTEAIDRMKKWLWDNGDRSNRSFVDDLNTLIRVAQNEQRQELVRRFAVSLVGTEWCYNPEARDFAADKVWEWAEKLADAEPKIGDSPTEQCRLICERCGDSGTQPAGCWTGKAYDSLAGRCELCAQPSSNP